MKMTRLNLLTAALISATTMPVLAADVQVYGRAHLSVDSLDNGESSATNVSSNSSRLGFKASTKLDSGLEAFVQIEQNIRMDEGSGNWASRDTFVGVKGNFGQVRLGQFDTPLKIVRGKVDMFGDRIGDIRNLTRTSTSGDTNANIGNVFDERYKNGVHYRTPKFGNVTFDVHYTPHNNTGAVADNVQESYSLAVSYESSKFYAALAYETFEGANDLDPTALRAGAYVNVTSSFRVAAMYQDASDVPGGDRQVYGLGASYKLDKVTLRGQYYIADENDNADTGADMFVIGADYAFGKELTGYIAYGVTANDDNANYRVSAGGHDTQLATVRGKDATGLSLGLIYNF